MPRLTRIFSNRRYCTILILISAFILTFYILSKPNPAPGSSSTPTRRHQEEYIDRKGIRVIVGHYKEEDGPAPNFTQSELNLNRYSPVAGAGDGGQPVLVKNHQQIISKRLWFLNQFNLVASDSISVDRNLSDVRSEDCRSLRYPVSSLPSTSVIIVFHNEAWSTLVRTIHSVINTSPRQLLQEIVLVDDASERSFLKEELENEISSLSVPTRVVRSRTRIGLIKARLMGARASQGSVLTFLDAHCECTKGWLEPLLHRIWESPTSVVSPVIDILNDETFQYTKSFSLHWGAFNWELHFRWFTMGTNMINKRRFNSTVPYGTPVMAGGLFSILSEYFWSSGSYDEEMDIWGGENLEMSFRIWQCGGRVEISPCSRVGHVFRKASPYTFPREGGVGAVLHGNLARLAKTWMDDYAKFYFKINPKASQASLSQDVSKRLELRRKMNCKSFEWFLETVWPENFFPRPGQFFGKLLNINEGKCLQKPRRRPGSHSSQPSGPAILENCVKEQFYGEQMFTMNKDGYLMGDESTCLDAPQWREPDAGVRFSACSEQDRQGWEFSEINSDMVQVKHKLSGLCLSVPSSATSDSIILEKCSDGKNQVWKKEVESW
ncbi:polypeptide N-acetylgalactosaminyltransferase 13 [Eurytemora carolleeae]|uniref:polypeptide N-acetylgalactosaminyltransferase 13 n=1 Tax=Eurytemora carolleeae TaxID=1294199 RepID=UPI000C76DF65|nr:polypeptide N-acetylgalactosaminyltransferase 13 [Eurytemora carolleeae]|eukprot:XP_023320235.1 polypeptide N-acetylgalactosaminyltransferase 13-like [Eurytemora affinis]